MAGLSRDDLQQIETFRATATPEETARFAAELYKLRNTPSSSFFSGFPTWLIICISIWLALLETADKLPQLLLSYPRYQAALAEANAKLLQPDLAVAQLEKARNDAQTSAIQPELTTVQLQRAKLETLAAAFQPKLSELQVVKLGIDTKLASISLPVAEQATALSGAYLNAMNPLITGILGMFNPSAHPLAAAPDAAVPASNPPAATATPRPQGSITPSPSRTQISTAPAAPVPFQPNVNSDDYLLGRKARAGYERVYASLPPNRQQGWRMAQAGTAAALAKGSRGFACDNMANSDFTLGCVSEVGFWTNEYPRPSANFLAGFNSTGDYKR